MMYWYWFERLLITVTVLNCAVLRTANALDVSISPSLVPVWWDVSASIFGAAVCINAVWRHLVPSEA